ncbi:phenylacetate--CoA ligase family protein, partial [Vibrio cholerae]|nr:phenylacetate--CoA ligase family protein [Vibrio cholerae]
GVNGLLATQFLQKDINKVTVLVVVESRAFDMTQEEVLIKNTKDRIGKNICVEIVKVDSIPKTKNGKTRQAICLI